MKGAGSNNSSFGGGSSSGKRPSGVSDADIQEKWPHDKFDQISQENSVSGAQTSGSQPYFHQNGSSSHHYHNGGSNNNYRGGPSKGTYNVYTYNNNGYRNQQYSYYKQNNEYQASNPVSTQDSADTPPVEEESSAQFEESQQQNFSGTGSNPRSEDSSSYQGPGGYGQYGSQGYRNNRNGQGYKNQGYQNISGYQNRQNYSQQTQYPQRNNMADGGSNKGQYQQNQQQSRGSGQQRSYNNNGYQGGSGSKNYQGQYQNSKQYYEQQQVSGNSNRNSNSKSYQGQQYQSYQGGEGQRRRSFREGSSSFSGSGYRKDSNIYYYQGEGNLESYSQQEGFENKPFQPSEPEQPQPTVEQQDGKTEEQEAPQRQTYLNGNGAEEETTQIQTQKPSKQATNRTLLYSLTIKLKGDTSAHVEVHEQDDIDEIARKVVQEHKLPKEMKEALQIYIQRKLEAFCTYKSLQIPQDSASKKSDYFNQTSEVATFQDKQQKSGYRGDGTQGQTGFVPRNGDPIHQQTISATTMNVIQQTGPTILPVQFVNSSPYLPLDMSMSQFQAAFPPFLQAAAGYNPLLMPQLQQQIQGQTVVAGEQQSSSSSQQQST